MGSKKTKKKKVRKPTERELVKLGLANNATAEIMEKYLKWPKG